MKQLRQPLWILTVAVGAYAAGTLSAPKPAPVPASAPSVAVTPRPQVKVAAAPVEEPPVVIRPAAASALPREMFQPLVQESSGRGEREERGREAGPAVRIARSQPDGTPTQSDEDDKDEAAPAPGSALKMVGMVTAGGARRALVKDLERNVSLYAREGETVFGYTVRSVSTAETELERDGERLRLALEPEEPEIELIGAGAGLVATAADLKRLQIPGLPTYLQAPAIRLLPPGGEVRQVRTDRNDGQTFWRVQKTVDGLDYELRLATDGRVIEFEAEQRAASLPPNVVVGLKASMTGYRVDEEAEHELDIRNGERSYEVVLVADASGRRVRVRTDLEGKVLRIDEQRTR